MDHGKETAIRARAYQLWVESGYADGDQHQHWRRAEREVEERAAAGTENAGGRSPPAEADGATVPRGDGMSLHPSVLDEGRGRRSR